MSRRTNDAATIGGRSIFSLNNERSFSGSDYYLNPFTLLVLTPEAILCLYASISELQLTTCSIPNAAVRCGERTRVRSSFTAHRQLETTRKKKYLQYNTPPRLPHTPQSPPPQCPTTPLPPRSKARSLWTMNPQSQTPNPSIRVNR